MSKKALLLASAGALLMAQPAYAQLDEIIVTATKRAESIQDVSVSLIATSGEEISEFALTNAADVTSYMPAVTITQNPIGNFVFIRGIGTPGANQGIEQSSTIFHDGVYMGRHQLSRAPFMDLERVEVLRGPQSILFGKNTIGGAVSVIAAMPTREFEAGVTGLYGWEEDEKEINGYISGPITDNLRARISGRYYATDGYLTNVIKDTEGPNREDYTFRGQLEWDATDTFKVNLKYETSSFEQNEQSTQLAVTDPILGGVGTSGLNQLLVATATGGDGVETYDLERAVDNDGGALIGTQLGGLFAGLPGFPDLPEFSNNKMDIASATINWDIGDHTLTSITAYGQYDYQDVCDCDFAALPLIQVNASEDYSQFSQEVRIASPLGNTFDYIVGAYYQDTDLEYRSGESFGATLAFQLVGVPSPLLVPNLTRDYGLDQKASQFAIFGETTWNVSDRTRFTGGLRYFEEDKTASHFLDKRFTGGWDYSALLTLPAGSVAFGDTAADYDRFLATFGQNPIAPMAPTFGQLTEGVFGGLLGTFEHNIVDRKRSESDVNWSLGIEYDFNDDVLGYAKVATGTKGGGFDARFLRRNDNPNFEYDEETATSYEAGFKSTLLDGNMTFNMTGFYSTVKDYQVSIFDGATAFFVQNAAEIETKGIELDVNWAATDELTLGFAGSYLDASYKDFPNAPCFARPTADCVGFGTPAAFRDASGDTNIFSPDLSFTASADYRKPIGENLEGRVTINLVYSDAYFVAADLDPVIAVQPSFTKIDARLGLGQIDGNWELALIGKNLTDELTSGNSNDQPLVAGNGFAQTDRPRSFALQASYKFK